MGFFTFALFLAVVFILIGMAIIIKVVFDINIPVLRIALAFFLIYFGIKLLTGVSFKDDNSKTVLFSDEKMKLIRGKNEFNAVFGKATIDLTSLPDDTLRKAEINVIFSNADILIDNSKPLKIKASSVFGAVNFPDETIISFGERIYKTSTYRENEIYTEIKLNVVFGNASIKQISGN